MLKIFISILFLVPVAQAKIVTKTVEYKDGDQVLEGVVSYNDKLKSAPGILVVHNWMGISDETKRRVKMLAELGYVAFAADIYGKGVRPKGPEEAVAFAKKYKEDVPTYRSRLTAGLENLKKQPQVNAKKLAAIGYCFGGTGALELARSGADLKGFVTFHGGLANKTPADAKNIKGEVLVLHGADDPYVPASEVEAFEKEMKDAHVKYEVIKYPGAVHAFSEKSAGSDKSKGAAYNARADKESWKAMQIFFKEIF